MLRSSAFGRLDRIVGNGGFHQVDQGGYVAAKHGVLGLVKVLGLEGAAVGISASARRSPRQPLWLLGPAGRAVTGTPLVMNLG